MNRISPPTNSLRYDRTYPINFCAILHIRSVISRVVPVPTQEFFVSCSVSTIRCAPSCIVCLDDTLSFTVDKKIDCFDGVANQPLNQEFHSRKFTKEQRETFRAFV